MGRYLGPKNLYRSEMPQRLAVSVHGQETLATYLRMQKCDQDDLKDESSFVAGTLKKSRRKGKAVTGLDIITLDIDAMAMLTRRY